MVKDLFKGLRVYNPETQGGNTQSVLKKEEKLRILIVKSTFLGRISPAFLASALVQDGDPLTRGLDACTFFPQSFRCSQRVIWKFDVSPGIDAGLKSSDVEVPRLVKTRIALFPHTSTYVW